MLERVCKVCSIRFLRKKSQILYSGGNFCSNKCRTLGRRTGKYTQCSFCGIEIYQSLSQLKKSKSGNHFCSKGCLFKWIYNKYDGHPNWKGGHHNYRDKLKKITKIPICHYCGEKDQRMLVVHHIDKNRKNNSLNNLVWLCHNCHYLIHNYEQEKNKFTRKLM